MNRQFPGYEPGVGPGSTTPLCADRTGFEPARAADSRDHNRTTPLRGCSATELPVGEGRAGLELCRTPCRGFPLAFHVTDPCAPCLLGRGLLLCRHLLPHSRRHLALHRHVIIRRIRSCRLRRLLLRGWLLRYHDASILHRWPNARQPTPSRRMLAAPS